MAESPRTAGEVIFEEYLKSQRISFEFEKEHPGKIKRPDYTIEWDAATVVFDVKDFDPPEKFPTGFGYADPYARIREKIEQGRDKFKQFKEYCCGLVLHNLGQPHVSLNEPDIMLGAMYGDSGFMFPVDTSTGVGDAGQVKQAFLGGGKMIRPDRSQPQNTTLSAIIALMKIRPHLDLEFEVPRVIVWYNAVARISFPSNLFRGEYDTHVGIVHAENGVFELDVTYEGNLVPNRLKLFKPPDANP
jgi:hypothetical protein